MVPFDSLEKADYILMLIRPKNLKEPKKDNFFIEKET